MKFDAWKDFASGDWQMEINVRDFIQKNYTPYVGNSDFLTPATEKTKKLWDEVLDLVKHMEEKLTQKLAKYSIQLEKLTMMVYLMFILQM